VTHGLIVNHNKTKAMIFRKESTSSNRVKLDMSGHEIETVASLKNLGCILDSHISETCEVERLLKIFNSSTGMFFLLNSIILISM